MEQTHHFNSKTWQYLTPEEQISNCEKLFDQIMVKLEEKYPTKTNKTQNKVK